MALNRCDQTGPPLPNTFPETIPGRIVTLAQSSPQGASFAPVEMWLRAQGATLTGGLGDQTLVTATDATYPRGYVGFGTVRRNFCALNWVKLQGGP